MQSFKHRGLFVNMACLSQQFISHIWIMQLLCEKLTSTLLRSLYCLVLIDQGLFSVPALVFELAQLTSQKRFDGGYVIFEPSIPFLGTSYGQIVVAVFT